MCEFALDTLLNILTSKIFYDIPVHRTMRSDTARAVRYRAVVDVRDSGRVSTRMHRMLPVVPSTNMTGDTTLHSCWAKYDVIVIYIKFVLTLFFLLILNSTSVWYNKPVAISIKQQTTNEWRVNQVSVKGNNNCKRRTYVVRKFNVYLLFTNDVCFMPLWFATVSENISWPPWSTTACLQNMLTSLYSLKCIPQ